MVSLDFGAMSGTQAPPDGSPITAVVTDRAHGVWSPAARREICAGRGAGIVHPANPVTSGGSFSYTLAYHNGTASGLSNAQLSLPVSVGTSFVSADGGGVLGTDRVVRWTLSSVPAGASGEVNVTLESPDHASSRTLPFPGISSHAEGGRIRNCLLRICRRSITLVLFFP